MNGMEVEPERVTVGECIVVGYPRSGNVWLARLLGDALNCPVTGWKSALTFAAEGKDRPGSYVVRQVLLKAEDISRFPGAQFVHIYRDPRDVAASVAAFWDIPIGRAIKAMVKGTWPVGICGTWREFVSAWNRQAVLRVRYDELPNALERILSELGWAARNPLDEVVHRQEFHAKRREIEQAEHEMPFGKERQLEHLYRGVSGRWREVFTEQDVVLATRYFGSIESWKDL